MSQQGHAKSGRQPYADPALPPTQVALVSGRQYESEMPDTLDLAERGALAIRGMTNVADPADDYLVFFLGDFVDWVPGRAFLRHHWPADVEGAQPKFMEALPLLRIMSGSDFNRELDDRMMDALLHMTAPDGLTYFPMDDRPWRKHHPTLAAGVPHACAFTEGRMILALNMWQQHDGNALWDELARKKIDKLRSLAATEDGCLYWPEPVVYPGASYFPLGTTSLTGSMPRRWNALDAAMVAHGSAQYYDITGNRSALELAQGLVRYYRRHGQVYADNGRFVLSHFHISTAGLIGALQTGFAAEDEELIEFARGGYDFAREMGEPLVGFFPEHLPTDPGQPDWKFYRDRAGGRGGTCETCEVADMILLAVKLSRAGIDDHWEDVERYTRNQFVENQMLRTDWVSKVPEVMANDKSGQSHRAVFPVTGRRAEDAGLFPAEHELSKTPGYVDETDAAERLVGTWAGWATANDFLDPVNGPGIMHCCTGNAARTLYTIWDSIVVREANSVRINLLLNRVSPWLDVDSHLPYEGRVDVRIKKATAIALRIPKWTRRDEVRCVVNGATRPARWAGNYVELDGLAEGDTVVISFPQSETRVFRMIGENIYHLTMRGDTVIEIDPQGELYPLYQRSHFRQSSAPLSRKKRFVSSETIRW